MSKQVKRSDKTHKNYLTMSLDELRDATKEYDREDVHPVSKSAPPKTQAAHDRTMRAVKRAGRGRPVVGEGSTAVLVSIEKGLLKEADKTAKARKLTRSELIALGLRTVIRKKSA
jgi:hypothetical protein